MSVRRILATVVAAAGAGSALATTAAPAQAATAVTVCYVYKQTGAAYANLPVDLWQVDSYGNWISKVRSGKTNSSGCGTFTNTPSNMYLRGYANIYVGGRLLSGASSRIALPGTGGANLGSSYVYQQI